MSLPAEPPLQSLAFFADYAPEVEDFRDAVIAGLSRPRKSIPPKFFYDARGAELFEAITETPEYYVTRTEIAALDAIGGEIGALVGDQAVVIEPGSGASRKVRILLDSVAAPAGYVAIDISRDHLIQSASAIAESYPDLIVGAVCADFLRPFDLPPEADGIGARRLVFFPGSTLGNFSPRQAIDILSGFRGLARDDGATLLGVDLVKDPAVLEAAYNDAAGITAAFNLNLLQRMRRELGADIEIAAFEHVAFFNEAESRIEMHLRSRAEQCVSIDGHAFEFAAGETIHTENSYKFRPDDIRAMGARAGLDVVRHWVDEAALFGIFYLAAAAP